MRKLTEATQEFEQQVTAVKRTCEFSQLKKYPKMKELRMIKPVSLHMIFTKFCIYLNSVFLTLYFSNAIISDGDQVGVLEARVQRLSHENMSLNEQLNEAQDTLERESEQRVGVVERCGQLEQQLKEVESNCDKSKPTTTATQLLLLYWRLECVSWDMCSVTVACKYVSIAH